MTAISFNAVDVLRDFGNLAQWKLWLRKLGFVRRKFFRTEFVVVVADRIHAAIPPTQQIFGQFREVNREVNIETVCRNQLLNTPIGYLRVRKLGGMLVNYKNGMIKNDFGN